MWVGEIRKEAIVAYFDTLLFRQSTEVSEEEREINDNAVGFCFWYTLNESIEQYRYISIVFDVIRYQLNCVIKNIFMCSYSAGPLRAPAFKHLAKNHKVGRIPCRIYINSFYN